LARLDEGPRQARALTLVSAPAGFGKTTLLSDWVRQAGWPAAWISLDEGDNDPARFLAYLVAALRQLDPDLGVGVLEARQAALAPTLPQLLTTLINQISASTGRFILVLDDFHLITAPPVYQAVEFLLDHLPENLHLAIATRADPAGLAIARLRGRGQLAELRQADLCFSPDEAGAFLNQVMALDLSGGDVAVLAARTEGWITGLQMAALSLQGRDRRRVADLIGAFGGGHHFVVDYLIEQVLSRQPPELQDFLLGTSILDRLTGPLCDAVLDGEPQRRVYGPSSAVLEGIERANLFLIPLDDERRWFRYHPLFADLLRKRLLESQPDRVSGLHARASAWCEQHGLMAEAIQHALSAGDGGRAAGLIEQAIEPTFRRSEVGTLLGWIESLPDEVVRARPRLGAILGGAMFMCGRPLAEAEARLQEAEAGDATGQAAGEVAAFRAFAALTQGDAPRSLELSRRALELLPPDCLSLRGLLADNLGLIHLLRGDVAAAAETFQQLAQIGQQTGNLMSAAAGWGNLGGLCLVQGQLDKADELFERALELATDSQGRRLPVAGKALFGLGEIARLRNDLDAATRWLTEGIPLVTQLSAVGATLGYVSLALVCQAQGEAQRAQELLDEAGRLARRFDASEMDDRLVALCQVRLWLMQGDVAAAGRWAEERGPDVGGQPALREVREGELLTLVRVRLAQGQPADALDVLEPLWQAAEKGARTRRLIETLALRALALHAQDDEAGALAALGRALSLAEPEGYVRVFLDEGPPMARLLHQAAARGVAPEYAGRLLAAFPDSAAAPAPRAAVGLVEPLSDRELEVLRLVAAGASNPEIARELVIAVNTVKKHINSLFGKLAVTSRTQAVARARGLGLIE
jgi:LuxR family maltose regulon positive regulatory protein